MYINCLVCETPINANYISYCTGCETPLFMPRAGEKNIHQSTYAVDLDIKHKTLEEDLVEEQKPKIEWGKVKQSKLTLVGISLLFIGALIVVGFRLMPFIFPERYVDKEKEVFQNMMKAQALLLKYNEEKKAFPDSLEAVLPANAVISIVNPVNGASGKGAAWVDYKDFDTKNITPGIVVYQKLPDKEFEMTGYAEKGIAISQGGAQIRVTRHTKQSDYKQK